MPGPSRPKTFDVAVVALSARALARSARRAGLRALSVDLFADADTREHAALAIRTPAARRGVGFDRKALLETIRSHAPAEMPVVLGAGFEHAPSLMRAIGERNPIAGASPETVALLKNPSRFATLLRDLNVPYPALADRAGPAADLLSKRVGASGGAHIRVTSEARPRRGRYVQSFVPGRSVSALFLAHGRSIRTLGFTEQWSYPSQRSPFRYGGAVGPITLPCKLSGEIEAALARVAAAAGLSGLASADMILTGTETGYVLLEVNPRPGATLDVFDRGDMPSLLALHLEAAAGRLPAALPEPRAAQAAAVVYAEKPIRAGALPRPVWTADWPPCDETVAVGAPFCTVFAAGPTPLAARALLAERRDALLASIRGLPAPATTKTQERAPA